MARFEGSMVAIVTPMKSGEVDLARYRELVEWQVSEGTDCIVPCGTTGEGVTLSPAERTDVLRATVEGVHGRVPVVAGAGSSSTREAIEAVRLAKELHVDGALVVTPPYNKPTQEGLFRHYAAIAEATRFPIIAYNVPSRTSVDLLPETTARLLKAGAIVGLKDATASMDRQIQLLERIGREGMVYLSGDDASAAAYLLLGGHGVISVVANVVPRAMKELVLAGRRGEAALAVDRQVRMAELNRAMFIETSPAPVKAALGLMGRASAEVRLPLAPLSEASLTRLREAMVRYGVLP
ncbi:MAG TPA: 4-hydroxy-tetrahydrodipicolinate synthase [Anaeromyxobacter sp.]|nr:4-hydroxy-tetrahydrodipicolinate synthase [Anaeromyxobacter sp.]